jgi:hypothetical protein
MCCSGKETDWLYKTGGCFDRESVAEGQKPTGHIRQMAIKGR